MVIRGLTNTEARGGIGVSSLADGPLGKRRDAVGSPLRHPNIRFFCCRSGPGLRPTEPSLGGPPRMISEYWRPFYRATQLQGSANRHGFCWIYRLTSPARIVDLKIRRKARDDAGRIPFVGQLHDHPGSSAVTARIGCANSNSWMKGSGAARWTTRSGQGDGPRCIFRPEADLGARLEPYLSAGISAAGHHNRFSTNVPWDLATRGGRCARNWGMGTAQPRRGDLGEWTSSHPPQFALDPGRRIWVPPPRPFSSRSAASLDGKGSASMDRPPISSSFYAAEPIGALHSVSPRCLG